MAQNELKQHRNLIGFAYFFMFLALFTIVSGIVAYVIAMQVTADKNVEVWANAQALWVMRNTLLFMMVAVFASLWFIPLYYYPWDAYQWVTGCTVAGVIFAFIAWVFLLNAFVKGIHRYFKNKPVF